MRRVTELDRRSGGGTAVIAIGVTSGGSVYAAQTVAAPAPAPLTTAPAAARSAVLELPAPSSAADVVDAALAAADDAIAEATAVAARPRYTCEPDADARVVDGIIVNENCSALNGAREMAQRQYATSGEAQYDWSANGPGAADIARENALQACREQAGMTTDGCQADAAAGNAN